MDMDILNKKWQAEQIYLESLRQTAVNLSASNLSYIKGLAKQLLALYGKSTRFDNLVLNIQSNIAHLRSNKKIDEKRKDHLLYKENCYLRKTLEDVSRRKEKYINDLNGALYIALFTLTKVN